MNLIEKVDDLIKQATTENSHFYTASVLREVRECLAEMEQHTVATALQKTTMSEAPERIWVWEVDGVMCVRKLYPPSYAVEYVRTDLHAGHQAWEEREEAYRQMLRERDEAREAAEKYRDREWVAVAAAENPLHTGSPPVFPWEKQQ